MSSITTSLFLEFAIIFPFILHACTADTKTPRMDAIIQIQPSSKFRAECEKSIGAGKNRDLGGTSWDSISQECMMYCAFRKIGMMDSGANLRSDYLRKKIKQLHKVRKINEKAVYNGIMRCASRGAYDICKKSRNNADCFYEYINSDWVDGDLAWALGPNRPGSGGDFDADDLPWPPRPNWRADMKKGEHTKKH
ncbi:uncharacterized protein LOC135850047 isoform X3 [Planococcus citri]|uniref:uncharacterized protein LOC135850047 isoform X3 n=1 Tax=Planococcus citri TaxID=170843 RepID=UPI0031F8214C